MTSGFSSRRAAASLALVALGVAGIAAVQPAGAVPPQPALQAAFDINYDLADAIVASGLDPDTSYTFTTAVGTWTNGTTSVDGTTDDTGYLLEHLTVPSSTPASVRSVTVTVTAAGDTTPTVSADLPILSVGVGPADPAHEVCPGTVFKGIERLEFDSVPDGTYQLSSPDVTFDPATVSTSTGFRTMARIGSDVPARIPISLTTGTGDDATTLTATLKRDRPYLGYSGASTGSARAIVGNCLPPDETVRIGAHPGFVGLPKTARTTSGGTLHLHETAQVVAHPRVVPSIAFRLSGGERLSVPTRAVPGTTLDQQVPESDVNEFSLLSARPGYGLFKFECDLSVDTLPVGLGATSDIWSVSPTTDSYSCTLQLSDHGELTMTDDRTGTVLWSSRSSGDANSYRLVMRDNGALTIVGSDGVAIWSSTRGRIHRSSAPGGGR